MGPHGANLRTTTSPSKEVRVGPLAVMGTALVLIVGSLAVSAPGSGWSSGPIDPATRESSRPGDLVLISATQTAAGQALAGPNGLTLYIRTTDRDATSTCITGPCARAWRALVADPTMLRIGPYVTGTFGITIWPDGTQQVIHNGQPLYYFSKDERPGDATGHGAGDVWCVAPNAAESGCDVLSPGEKWNLQTFHAPRAAERAAATADDY